MIGTEVADAATSCDNNVIIGDGAVGTGVLTGNQNVVIGSEAGKVMTSANNNVIIGYQAGEELTTGQFNILIGRDAGEQMTGGGNATIVGYQAGQNNTAHELTAFGSKAANGNTSGDGITAIGREAYDTADTEDHNTAVGLNSIGGPVNGGEYNVAVGNYTLDALTSSDFNTAVGYQAGSAVTTGDGNTLFGYQAGLAVTGAGAYNVCLGVQAGLAITTGIRNTMVGQAGYNYDTENDNTGIGHAAVGGPINGGEFNVGVGNFSLDALTSGDDNTAVGYNSGTNIAAGTDNLALGKDAMSVVVGGSGNICIGSGADVADGAADFTTAIGFQVGGTAGYTTIGKTTDDIRAAHGNTTWNTVSDERFKKNIETSDAGLAVINDLRPVTYNWKTKGEVPEWSEIYEQGSNEQYKNSKHNHGFIAQEVKAVIDSHSELKDGFNMWDERPDGQQEVGETAIVPILVKAVQPVSKSNTRIKCRNRNTKSKIIWQQYKISLSTKIVISQKH